MDETKEEKETKEAKDAKEAKNISKFRTEELLCNVGLYQKIGIDCSDFINEWHEENDADDQFTSTYQVCEIKHSEQFQKLVDFMMDSKNIYMFCPLCNKKMSFKLSPITLSEDIKKDVLDSYSEDFLYDDEFSTSERLKMSEKIKKIVSQYRWFDKEICCTHENSHVFKFSFLLQKQGQFPDESLTLTKIGQWPSINDFSGEHIKSYKKLLKKYGEEYTKALGLFSSGIGIGSFVYLRRIIEFLMENAFKRAEIAGKLTRDQYMKVTLDQGKERNRRADEKIKMLKGYLPEFIVRHAEIYGIISKGIHELSEDECLEIFPVLQNSIELILDEEIAMQKKTENIKSAETALGKVNRRLKEEKESSTNG